MQAKPFVYVKEIMVLNLLYMGVFKGVSPLS